MDPELAELIARIADLNDDELETLRVDLLAAADGALDAEATDETLEVLEALKNGIAAVRAEQTTRTEAAAAREERRAALEAEIRGSEETDETTEGESTETETTEGESTETATEETATEETTEVEAVAAAATTPPTPGLARISHMAARRPAARAPRRSETTQPGVLVAAANVSGLPMGTPLDTSELRAQAFRDAITAAVGWQGPSMKVPLMRAGRGSAEFPADRFLDGDTAGNEAKFRASLPDPRRPLARQVEAIVAAGGFCAPLAVSYDQAVISQGERPARDALPRYGADRGGIRFVPPPVLTDVSGAVGVHTNANDVSGTTKPVLTALCKAEQTVQVEAITRIVKFGNFNARTFPEQVDAIMQLTAAAHARLAEREILAAIAAKSTAVTTGQLLGTTRDVLAELDRVVAAYRNRHRMAPEALLDFYYPEWLEDQIRADLAREMPGAASERLAVADAQIDNFFSVRRVDVHKLQDGEAGQDFGAQGVGPATGWPSTVITYLHHKGAFQFLDGGTLDLGIVRDSTLNNTNDFELFMETFEGVAFRGVEALKVTFDVCPNGEASALATINPCSTGS